eukprot:jgi/Bigna1/86668/estExt_fgenesh1_pg.C_120191
MRKRRHPDYSSADELITIKLPHNCAITSKICSSVTCDVIKYILYIRQQIPCPYDEVKLDFDDHERGEQKDGRRRKARISGSSKRQKRFVETTEALLNGLGTSLFKGGIVMEVLLLLGPSIYSPKEVYSITFSNDLNFQQESSDKILSKIKKRLIRQMISCPSPAFNKEMKPTRLFTLIRRKARSSSDNAFEPASFSPKHNFRLKLKKAVLISIHICSASQLDINMQYESRKRLKNSEGGSRNQSEKIALEEKDPNPSVNLDMIPLQDVPLVKHTSSEQPEEASSLWSLCKFVPKGLKASGFY